MRVIIKKNDANREPANLSKLMTSFPNIVIAVVVALRFCPRCRRRCIRLRSDTVPHVEVPKKLDK